MTVTVPFHTLCAMFPPAAITSDVVRAGYQAGTIRSREVCDYFLDLQTKRPLSAIEEEIALVLSDEYDRLNDLLARLSPQSSPTELAADVWIYGSLRHLRDRWSEFDDPWAEAWTTVFYWGDPEAWTCLTLYPPPERSRLLRWWPLRPERPFGIQVDAALESERDRSAAGAREQWPPFVVRRPLPERSPMLRWWPRSPAKPFVVQVDEFLELQRVQLGAF